VKPNLTIELLKREAAAFGERESKHAERSMYGVTDGKAVGTYPEHKFMARLSKQYSFTRGNSAKGIDLPRVGVDIKTTSIRQPQSSCPFSSARQKIYGLGYSLLVFVYEKTDVPRLKSARLDIQHVVFVEAAQTGDFQMTRGIQEILARDGNADDLIAFMNDRLLPADDVEVCKIAEDLLKKPPVQGYLTISNALQWRLQYRRVIDQAGYVPGVHRIR